MNRIEPIILVAAVGFYALAMTSQGVIPLLEKEVTLPETVRTIDGKDIATPHRTALEDQGRKIYIREGCWYCHSQFVRPVNRDTEKWGPVSQAGEMIYDVPQMLGTRRIGPDLSREGNRRSDAWHYAHFFNPRATEPESMMPSFTWLFNDDKEHDRRVIEFIEKNDKNHDGRVTQDELDKNGDGTVEADELPADWKSLDVWPVNEDGSVGDGIVDMHDYGPVPTAEGQALEAYVQTLGTAIGDWRIWEPWPTNTRSPPTEPLAIREHRGKVVYEAKCAGCHGLYGNGRANADLKSGSNFNVAYHFLDPQPRDFTRGSFKSRTTPSGELPRDEDLFRVISRGIQKGRIMPAWGNAATGHILTEQDRWDLVDYVKSLSPRFKAEKVSASIDIPTPPYARAQDAPAELVREGKLVYRVLQCWSCHGNGGKGDGPSALGLFDDWGVPIRPFNFTSGSFKFGDSPADVYRTFNTGLNGTPMPSFFDTILFPREAFPDLHAWQQPYHGKSMFDPSEVKEIADYIAGLPSSQDIDKMSGADKKAFADHRRWALVYYALSLAKDTGGAPLPTTAGFTTH